MNRLLSFLAGREIAWTKVLSHEWREDILAIASQRRISPLEFARLVGESLEDVEYHFKELVKHRALEMVRGRPGETSTRHYRATAKAAEVGRALFERRNRFPFDPEDL